MEKIKQDLYALQAEITTKNERIQSLETSDKKSAQSDLEFLEKMTDSWAVKIFENDKKQTLRNLITLKPQILYDKYEEMMGKAMAMARDKERIKYEEISDKLSKKNLQLTIQIEKREAIEKQHSEVMDIINNAVENKCLENILPSIKSLKNANSKMQHEQIEANLYSDAQAILESSKS